MPLVLSAKPPSYRLHKARNQAFVQWKGKRYYLGPYGTEKSRGAYQRFLAEVWTRPHAEPIVPEVQPGDAITITELAAHFWTWASAYYAGPGGVANGQVYLVRSALRPLRQLYGDCLVTEFGPKRLEALQQRLVDEGKARGYVNHLVQIIRQTFRWGTSKELVPVAVYQALATVAGLRKGKTSARETAPVGPVSDAAVEATLSHLPLVVADMVRLQRLTGCRPGEVCSLRPCDVDRTSDPWVYRPATHKTAHRGKARAIYIGPKAQEVLSPYLLRPGDAYCFSPAESVAKRKEELRSRRKSPIRSSQIDRRKPRPERKPGDRYLKDAYATAVRRSIATANRIAAKEAAARGEEAPDPIPHWHPNQLRHSAATEIRKLFGLEAAQVALGHSRADVTQMYAERDCKLAAEVARRIG